MDMRAGAERLMSCVVQTTGAARAHHGYLFANARATRIKLLVHDGFGVWCAARRQNAGHIAWPREAASKPLSLTQAQFDALVVGLPWQRLPEMSVTRGCERRRDDGAHDTRPCVDRTCSNSVRPRLSA
jgi:transposase